jgi:hypothetical protein
MWLVNINIFEKESGNKVRLANHRSNPTEPKIEGETTTKQWSENMRDEAVVMAMKLTINSQTRNKPDNHRRRRRRRRMLMKTTNPEQKTHIGVRLFLNHMNNDNRDRTQQLKLELANRTWKLQSDRNSTDLDEFKTQSEQKLWTCEKNRAYCGQGDAGDYFNYPKKGLRRWCEELAHHQSLWVHLWKWIWIGGANLWWTCWGWLQCKCHIAKEGKRVNEILVEKSHIA